MLLAAAGFVILVASLWFASKRHSPEGGLCYVPGGEYIVGNGKSSRLVTLESFYIDKHEVTNREFEEYATAVAARQRPANWRNGTYPPEEADSPVSYVTLGNAKAYAEWRGMEIPTEEQWEAAARGLDGKRWPWGNEYQENGGNIDSDGVKRIGSFPHGVSPSGALDMAGNVWEWTVTSHDSVTLAGKKTQMEEFYVLKGGSWLDPPSDAECWKRRMCRKDDFFIGYGFRCIRRDNEG